MFLLIGGKYSYLGVLITTMLVVAIGCSVEKNTGTTRFYHSLTSKYNIYFNGNESFKAGADKVIRAYKDNYSELLRVFEYSDPLTVSISSADMERAIQKASKVISLKSITAKPEVDRNKVLTEQEEKFLNRREYNDWVEKSYLLMGKARVYKHDYELAKLTLSYNISNAYDPEVKAEASIWLAQVYAETGNYNEAQRILTELEITKGFPKNLLALYYATFTDLYTKQKRFGEAAESLEKALNYVSGKRNKCRFTFLLAQLYEKNGDKMKAAAYYRKIINMNPPYEMEFNARINLAGVFDTAQDNPAAVRKEIGKMIKDPKNKEYLDQIYYALAGLSQKEGKYEEAINYYKKSAALSTSNKNQKGKSFLALADYYFALPDYVNAGKYYDSAVYFLDERYPEFQSLRIKSSSLNNLLTQLSIIQREDSLQRVAAMNPSERNILIASIIENVRKNEAEAQASGQSSPDRYNLGQYYENERRFQGNIEQEGKWYFYNQAALTFGRTEFRRRWGERKLEDNWRRLNKARVSPSEQAVAENVNGNGNVKDSSGVADNKRPEYYMRDLPLNDSLIRLSNERIASAFLAAGRTYHEIFSDNKKAVETFETLIKRFPESVFEAEALYNIYNIYKESNAQMAEVYRQRLVEKYPDNEFTKIISDPMYYKRKAEEARQVENLYQEAYTAYSSRDYVRAEALCNNGLSKYPDHELAPKFQLLKSYSIAQTADVKTFKDELGKVIKLWPGTEEAQRASELIAFLNQEIPELKIEEDKQTAKEIYGDDKSSPHLFVLVIMNKSFNINQATFDVISYNIDKYTNRNFRTSGELVDDKYIMISVSGFKDLKEAMDYYQAFNIEKEVRNPSGSKMFSFIIGQKNLEVLMKDKDPEKYRLFFIENYLPVEVKN